MLNVGGLSRDLHDPAVLAPKMQGLPAEAMQAWPVARTVNRSSAEGVALISRLDAGDLG